MKSYFFTLMFLQVSFLHLRYSSRFSRLEILLNGCWLALQVVGWSQEATVV